VVAAGGAARELTGPRTHPAASLNVKALMNGCYGTYGADITDRSNVSFAPIVSQKSAVIGRLGLPRHLSPRA